MHNIIVTAHGSKCQISKYLFSLIYKREREREHKKKKKMTTTMMMVKRSSFPW